MNTLLTEAEPTVITLTILGEPKLQKRHRTTLIQPGRKEIDQADKVAQHALAMLKKIQKCGNYTNEQLENAELRANMLCRVAVETRAKAKPAFLSNYDPSKKDKDAILTAVWDQRPAKPFAEPLRVDITWYFPRPKNHYRTGKYAAELKPNAPEWHTTKTGDIDNAHKIILDALNGTFWRDDCLVCCGLLEKKYSDRPRTVITIKTLT